MNKHKVYLGGGLGNQLFHYATMRYVRDVRKQRCNLDYSEFMYYGHHCGSDLRHIVLLPLMLRTKLRFYDFIRSACDAHGLRQVVGKVARRLMSQYERIRSRGDDFKEINTCRVFDHRIKELIDEALSCDFNCKFVGNYQHNDILLPAFQYMRKSVRRCESKKHMGGENVALLKQLEGVTTVSIHIRRGDYLALSDRYINLALTDYYQRAIDEIKARVGNDFAFVVFSDDITWVMENMHLGDRAVYVDWNTGENSWRDMVLMSQCSHNIMANSTFSFWGAFLNRNPDKIVIAPDRFVNGERNFYCYQDGWIVIDVHK